MGPTAIRNRPSGPPSIRDARDRGEQADRGKSPLDEGLMSDSRLIEAERRLQPKFIKWLIVGAFLLLTADRRSEWPDRQPLPDRMVALHLDPLFAGRDAGGGAAVSAWKMRADDPRFFGLSALTILPGGRLQALSDSGVLVTFARPGAATATTAWLSDLPDGPGYPTFKKGRDSESMILDSRTGQRLVAFEFRHSLWFYRADGSARSLPVRLPWAGWRVNNGIEAMVRESAGGPLLLIHEAGRHVFRMTGSPVPQALPLSGATGGIADAARLPDGRIVVAVREAGTLGLTNRLAWLEGVGGGYRLRNLATLPLGTFDNVEGLAAETRPGRGAVIWAVTDNDDWRRTLLLRIELDATKAPAGAGA